MYNEPLGYFITFTTRGSWLHGDERGSIVRGGQFVPPNPNWVKKEMANLNDPPLLFPIEQRKTIEAGLRKLCTRRNWFLHEINVRTNHVHIVLTAKDIQPERVMSDLKAKATRVLRQAKFLEDERKPWTEHGSTVYLFTQEKLDAACHYVRECQ